MKIFLPLALSRFWALIREYLFGEGCALCGKSLLDGEGAWYGLCRECREALAIDRSRRCSSCGRPLISEMDLCAECRREEGRDIDGIFAVYPYAGMYRKLLTAYKFGKNLALGNFLAERLAEARSLLACTGLSGAAWVPVPPRAGKIKAAGWDQIDYLARRVPSAGIPAYSPPGSASKVSRCLRRLPSRSQKELGREDRKNNLRGRILCPGKPPAECLLFDDVITTGSTLDVCAAALKEAGAEKVWALGLFHT